MFAFLLTAYTPLLQKVERRWDRVALWVESESKRSCFLPQASCLVLVHPHSEVLPFERYYRGSVPVAGFYPLSDRESRDLRIVKTNWQNLVTEKNVQMLERAVFGFKQVFLILGETDQTASPTLVKQWFWENGWRRAGGKWFGPLEVVELTSD